MMLRMTVWKIELSVPYYDKSQSNPELFSHDIVLTVNNPHPSVIQSMFLRNVQSTFFNHQAFEFDYGNGVVKMTPLCLNYIPYPMNDNFS